MQFESVIRSMLQSPSTEAKSIQFKSGQIFFGRLGRLHSGQYAEISLLGQKLMAKIEAPLISGKGYWFQVSQKSGEMVLKVLEQESKILKNNEQLQPTPQLLGLRDTKPHRMFTDFLMKEQVKLTKEEIQHGARFVSLANDRETALQVINMMSKRQLPFTESIFHSLYTVCKDTTSLSASITHLQNLISNEKHTTETMILIKRLLEDWQANEKQDQKGTALDQITLLTKMKEAIFKTGLGYESRLLQNHLEKFEDQIKPLLVKLTQEQSIQNPVILEKAEHMLWKLNGQQLLSVSNNNIQTHLFEIPIQLGGKLTDLSVQWTGKKQKNGQFDSDYCHIVFYLDLENLESTVINMQVQNRIVNVFIYNNWEKIKDQAQPLIPLLQAGLESLNYQLSGVYFKKPETNGGSIKKQQWPSETNFDTGVDIRV